MRALNAWRRAGEKKSAIVSSPLDPSMRIETSVSAITIDDRADAAKALETARPVPGEVLAIDLDHASVVVGTPGGGNIERTEARRIRGGEVVWLIGQEHELRRPRDHLIPPNAWVAGIAPFDLVGWHGSDPAQVRRQRVAPSPIGKHVVGPT